MSYVQFLAFLLVPPLVLVGLVAAVRLPGPADRRAVRRTLGALGVYLVLAVVWTAPWDGYLIVHGVWTHGDVIGRFLRVPAEEYAFMVGQTILTGLWTVVVLTARSTSVPGAGVAVRFNRRLGSATAWAVAALACWLVHPLWTEGFYLTAIVGWFGPLFALQAAVGADRLAVAGPRLRLLAVGVPTAYLWVADRIAIGAGTWSLDPELTLPVRPLGLPVEEAVFFLVTNLVLVNGLILASDPTMWHRFTALRAALPGRHRTQSPPAKQQGSR